MAWFRAGGGGIPSSLKSDMNDVFNKKFGTVLQDYPPEDWPETVNLMGPLPERMVSGSVVAFADGADDVPLKSASFEILASGGGGTPSTPVPIVGKSSVDVVHGVKNFVDDTLEGLEQGSISSDTGQNANSNTRVRNADYIPFPLDKIQPNYVLTIPSGYKIAMRFYDKNKNFVTPPAGAQGFINSIPIGYVGQGVEFARFILAKTDDSNITPNDMKNVGFQIEVGSTTSAYTEYVEPTTNTANLGQTVYGGTLSSDGTLTITHKVYETSQDDSNWLTGYYAFGYRYYQTAPQGAKVGGCKSDISVIGAGDLRFTVDSDNRLNAYCTSESGYDTLAKFKQALGTGIKILYELETPIIITGLDEISISTYLGDNTIWADTGDLSVTYRRDIDLALAQ